MFLIGDGIFYPHFGAGCIVNIEEKEIYGMIKKYYIIKLIQNGMMVMIPVDSEDSKRLRKIIGKDEYERIVDILSRNHSELPTKWVDRYRIYNKCIRDGDIFKMSEILRDINNLPKRKEISRSDSKMFNDILDMVAGELSLVLETEFVKARNSILDLLNK